mmetsp:Transcript_22475/g.48515  ORF Transcript_22475/g.48515 Transcript_22475/m.48515 type:complete len:80 (-) Transcript_22475:8-247(-)
MSVGYNVLDLEEERDSESFAELKTHIERILPVEHVRRAVLETMAKITFDGGAARPPTHRREGLGYHPLPSTQPPPAESF